MTAPVHFSTLRLMGRSPAHYREAILRPSEPSPAMKLGTAAHALVLGSWKEMAIWSGGIRRGKAWDEFREANAGKDIITESELGEAQKIADSVLAHRGAREILLAPGLMIEESYNFSISGRACSVRPDAWCPGFIVELKTTADANPARFPFCAQRLGYHAQLAWQIDALHRAGMTETRLETSYIVAVETKPPFVVQVYELTPNAIDFGRKTYSLWFERLLVCEASNTWPGYQEESAYLDAPAGADDLPLVIEGEEIIL